MDNIESSKVNSSQHPHNSQTNSISIETRKAYENGEKGVIKHTKTGNISNGPRYLGVRQRPSSRWLTEIKDSSFQKLRLWLGTYDRAEEAALAYDSAARLLKGRNAKINFLYHGTLINSHEENLFSLIGKKKNPRLYQLLLHAIIKNHAKSTSLIRNSYNHDSFGFDTIVCSSTSDDHGYRCHEFGVRDGYRNLCVLSCGTSKVYSFVIVAPSFSASLHQ